jgi:hypothetical protein
VFDAEDQREQVALLAGERGRLSIIFFDTSAFGPISYAETAWLTCVVILHGGL